MPGAGSAPGGASVRLRPPASVSRGPQARSLVRMLGADTALAVPDTRAERTEYQVISPQAYDMLFQRMAALPGSVRHLVLVLTVPIVFAKLPLSEGAMAMIDALPSLRTTLAKTSLGLSLVDKCAAPPRAAAALAGRAAWSAHWRMCTC